MLQKYTKWHGAQKMLLFESWKESGNFYFFNQLINHIEPNNPNKRWKNE